MKFKLTLKQNIIWNSIGSFVYLSLQWFITYGVTKYLGFSNAGIFSLCLSIGNVVLALSQYGIRGYQVSDVTNKYSDKVYVVSRAGSSLIAILGCLIYLAIWKYNFYTTICIIAYAFYKIAEAFADVYHGIMQKNMRMDIIGKSFILRGIITTAAFFICMLVTSNLFLSILVLNITMLLFVVLYDHRKVKEFYDSSVKYHSTDIKRLLFECLPLAINVFLSNIVASLPRIYLGNIKGDELLGIYSSVAIPAAIVQVFAGYVFAPMLPIFANQIKEKDLGSFKILFTKTILFITSLSAVFIIGGTVLGEFGLVIMFGEKIRDYVYLLVPILIVSFFTAISWLLALLLTVLRDFKGLIISSLIATIICLLGSSVFINEFSLNGASFILLLSLVVQIFLMSSFFVRALSIDRKHTKKKV